MEKYIQFLQKVNLYNKLLELANIIREYNKRCIINKDDKTVYLNLIKNRDNKIEEYEEIMRRNQICSQDTLKKEILENWNILVVSILFKNINIHYREDSSYLPLYGAIQNIVKETMEFYDIYKYLLENQLYNPNCICGISDEPFFSLLPIFPIKDFKELNKQVIQNKQTDFHVLINGTDVIKGAIATLKNSQTEEEKKYWRDYILWCCKGTCSLLDTKRFYTFQSKIRFEYPASIYFIFAVQENSELDEIQKYLLSDEGIEKQLQNSLYPSQERNNAIDFYIEKLGNKENLKRKLQKLKI